MKLTLLLLMAFVIEVSATVYSQSVKFNFDIKNEEVATVLEKIESTSNFRFFFQREQVDVNRMVDLKASDNTVEELLNMLFDKQDIGYKVMEDNLVLLLSDETLKKEIPENQQQKQIAGTVTDKGGAPLPGINIIEKGTNNGVISNSEGNFKINVLNQDAVLVFSFIGFETQEMVVGNNSSLKVVMNEAFKQLDEVVVTALGIKREKKALGYAVEEVNTAAILGSNSTNIVSALSGQVAGMSINTTSSQAGSSAHITIRGNSSINYNNAPLFIVDGIPYDNSERTIKDISSQGGAGNTGADIDPNNIESLSILKGAAASALYGSRAANGVVLITTKKGFAGQSKINYSFKTSLDEIYEIPLSQSWAQGDYVNGVATYADGETQKTNNSWGPRITDVPGAIKYDRWAMFQKGMKFEHNFNFSGGNEKVNYYAAVTNYNQKGVLEPITYNKLNMFFNVNAAVSKWLDATLSFTYTRSDADRVNEGLSRDVSLMCALLDMPWTWNPFPLNDNNGNPRSWTNTLYNNPYFTLDNTLNTNHRNRFLPVLGLNFKLAKGLSLNTKVGLDTYANTEDDFVNQGGKGAALTGRYSVGTSQLTNFNSDIILAYDKQISEDFSINALIGNNVLANRMDFTQINGTDFIIPNFKSISNCQVQNSYNDYSQKRSISVYGQAILGYKSMLYYTFTGRNDWSSTLPSNSNSYFYSSNSLGFVFSQLLNKQIISFGKLRVSFSAVGNDAPPYSINPVYQPGGGGGLTFPYNGVGTFTQSYRANNPALKNEMLHEFEVGLEMKFLNNRIGFETSLYNKKSFDQIVTSNISESTGYGSAILNVGEMENKGIELLVTATPILKSDFSWDVNLTWATNRNTVVEISEGVDWIEAGGWDLVIWKGYSYPSLMIDYFIKDSDGNTIVCDDPNASYYGYQIDAGHYKGHEAPVGKVEPDWRGGIRNTFSYKGFTLSAFLDMQFGGNMFNMNEQYILGRGMSALNEGRSDDGQIVWPGVKGHVDPTTGELVLSGEPNDIQVSYVKAFTNQYYKFISDYVMQKTDYIKLRELTLSYRIPNNLLSKVKVIKGCTITLSGNDLWRRFDKNFTGSDPEHNLMGSGNAQGMSIYMLPATRSYNFGVSLSF